MLLREYCITFKKWEFYVWATNEANALEAFKDIILEDADVEPTGELKEEWDD